MTPRELPSESDEQDLALFTRYSDEILPAYKRAVREALLMHKRAGNPVAMYRDGKIVLVQPDEIDIEDE